MKNFSRVSHKWVHYKRICFTASRSPQEPQDGQSSPESKYECVMRQRPMQSLFRSTESCLDTGVNPAGDAGDTSPNILVGGRQQEYPPPILLHTFGYSRPILVALRSQSLKLILFGYKMPPIRFSQAGGESAHKARPLQPVWRKCRLAYGPADATATHCLLL